MVGRKRGKKMYTCDVCEEHFCRSGKLEKLPGNCPSKETDKDRMKEIYFEEENYRIAYHSAGVEADGYCDKTRLEEIIDFSQRSGYKKLGVAFCMGLSKEAKILCRILRHHGFEVNSVICKNGSISKELLEIGEEQKISPGSFEPMCNPIGQAFFLNQSHTDLNIIIGLCVGHDSLFIKYSEAPVTVFAVKDRVLAHNPMGMLYLSDGYYKKKLYK